MRKFEKINNEELKNTGFKKNPGFKDNISPKSMKSHL